MTRSRNSDLAFWYAAAVIAVGAVGALLWALITLPSAPRCPDGVACVQPGKRAR